MECIIHEAHLLLMFRAKNKLKRHVKVMDLFLLHFQNMEGGDGGVKARESVCARALVGTGVGT